MLGFKRLDHAALTISGMELVHQIQKGQFDLSVLCAPSTRTPQLGEAMLAASVRDLGMLLFARDTQFAPQPEKPGLRPTSMCMPTST